MASIVNYVADGATNQFQIPFTYINQTDVVVTVNGTTPTFTFVNSTTINIASTPTSGAKVIIKRVTPVTALVDFTDGSTLFEADLDLAHLQNRLIAEESRERADNAIDTLNANILNINTVAGIEANVTTVAGNTTNINSVATNMAEVLNADTNAATATTKAGEASASASTASAQATISTTKAGESSTSAAEALASKNAASASESASSTSETNSANSATSSANSASASGSSASSASASQTVATTKAAEAVVSANNSAVSATNSANSATTATTKANEASASQSAAATSEANALSSKNAAASSATNGATSETNAATSETNAASSEAVASTKASEASTSATNAASSETNASNSATTATTQAGIATTKAAEAAASATSIGNAETTTTANAVAAANSAAAAATALDSFDDRYLGVKSSDPTVDNDGNALAQGALYFSSSSSAMQVYDGANWIAASSSGVASLTLFEYTATAGQTAFTGSDDNGLSMSFIAANLLVTMNGVILDPSDFTTSGGVTVTLGSGAALGDIVNIYAFKSFQVSDTVSASTGGTFAGAVSFSNGATVTGTVAATAYTGDGSNLTGTGSPSIDDNGNATALTIDSSENVLYGTTDTTLYNNTTGTGTKIGGDGRLDVARQAGTVATFNRTGSSDGEVIRVVSSGTTVGSVGVDNGNNLTISGDSSHSGFQFGTSEIFPHQNGTNVDSIINLGSAGNKFKDLYLSGGVYLGGTGAANKLDDYEEGTFTPSILNGWGILNPTYSTNAGFYTKVGNIVHVAFRITLSGGTTNANGLRLDGLPFTVGATTNVGTNLSGWFATASSNAENVFLGLEANDVHPLFYYQNANGTSTFLGTDAGTGFSMTFSGTYQTS